MGLGNVRFVDPVPKREVPSWLARADACILPYQDRALFAGALPNKTFDYLAAGRPIVAAAPAGELTRLVEAEGTGLAIAPEDPDALAGALARLADAPEEARGMGERGAALARGRFDRANLAARFVSVVESVGR
jgi:glycosyltransferase involved in cell wall biosynthesis